MGLLPFDFGDIGQPHAELEKLPDTPAIRDRLRARLDRGPTPTCAAAVLAQRGDASAGGVLSGVVAFLDAPDLAGVAALGLSDALACALASPWSAPVSRAAAASHLATAPVTAGSLAVLLEMSERTREPGAKEAAAALADVRVRADRATRALADQHRTRAALIKKWVGIRRQELQRDVATGELPASIALTAAEPGFFAQLVPPIPDAARPQILSAILACTRGADDATRTKLFALFQGRWRDVAREPLSALTRFSALRGKDAPIPVLAVQSLATLGATRELLYAAVSGVGEIRAAALSALERARGRVASDVGQDLLEAAVNRLEYLGESDAAARLRSLLVVSP